MGLAFYIRGREAAGRARAKANVVTEESKKVEEPKVKEEPKIAKVKAKKPEPKVEEPVKEEVIVSSEEVKTEE